MQSRKQKQNLYVIFIKLHTLIFNFMKRISNYESQRNVTKVGTMHTAIVSQERQTFERERERTSLPIYTNDPMYPILKRLHAGAVILRTLRKWFGL